MAMDSASFQGVGTRWGPGSAGSPPQPTEETGLMPNQKPKPLPKFKLPSETSVYSSMLYLPPLSRLASAAEWTRPSRLAVLLCILNGLLQMGVVYVISVYNHTESLANIRLLLPESQVIEQGHDVVTSRAKNAADRSKRAEHKVKGMFLPPHEKEELHEVYEIQPLCKRILDGDGTFTCMPHSVKFATEWHNLDTNGDGVWTWDEAKADKMNLSNKRHVSPTTVFNNLINGLRFHALWVESTGPNKSFYLSQDIQRERAIPKAYFNFWAGDAMMCGHFDPNSCEAAAKAGIFEEALVPGRMSAGSKGIRDLDSAIEYCYRMLQTGGGCEAALPTDFKRNREQRWGRCGARSLVEGGTYRNPYDQQQSVHVLEANYEAVDKYQGATSRLYVFFQSLIIMLWLLSLIDEWREILKFLEFLIVFPGLDGKDKGGSIDAVNEDGEPTYTISGISKKHRAVLVSFYMIRVAVCFVLTQFGTNFLLIETNYLDLVLNSLALTFVLTIDSMLYDLIEKDVKDSMERAKPIEFVTKMPKEGCLGYCLKKECWGLFLVPILSICIVLRHSFQEQAPILTVLRCACTQEGEKCLDSSMYQAAWWKDYWSKVLPSAIHQIEALRLGGK